MKIQRHNQLMNNPKQNTTPETIPIDDNPAEAKQHTNRKWTTAVKDKLLKDFIQYIHSTDHPTVTGFTVPRDIASSNIYDWPEWSDSIKKAKDKRREYCMTQLLADKSNPVKWLFLLKSDHGMYDQPRQEQAPQGDSVTLKLEGKTAQQVLGALLQSRKQINTAK